MAPRSTGRASDLLFAATFPEKTVALVLFGSYAKGVRAGDYPWASTNEQSGEEMAAVERGWGGPFDLDRDARSLIQDEGERNWFATYLRNSAFPHTRSHLTSRGAFNDELLR